MEKVVTTLLIAYIIVVILSISTTIHLIIKVDEQEQYVETLQETIRSLDHPVPAPLE